MEFLRQAAFGRHSSNRVADAGRSPGSYSAFTKFEGPDPMYWCHMGYAIANYDPRGSAILRATCTTGPRRRAATATTWWSGCRAGVVQRQGGDAGNSAPRHVPVAYRCRAPAASGMYRALGRHGRSVSARISSGADSPNTGSIRTSPESWWASGLVEDVCQMALDYPLMNAYWEDKSPI